MDQVVVALLFDEGINPERFSGFAKQCSDEVPGAVVGITLMVQCEGFNGIGPEKRFQQLLGLFVAVRAVVVGQRQINGGVEIPA